MTRSIRIMTGTTGVLLLASALALLLFIPVENAWPWILLFASVGAGLFAGFVVENDKVIAERRKARGAAD